MTNQCAVEAEAKFEARHNVAALALGVGLVAITPVIALLSQRFFYDVDFSSNRST